MPHPFPRNGSWVASRPGEKGDEGIIAVALKRIVMIDPDGRLAPILRQTLRAEYLSVAHVARDFVAAQKLLDGRSQHSVLIASAGTGQALRDFVGMMQAPPGRGIAGTAVLALVTQPTNREVRALIEAGVDQLASLPVNANQIDQKLRALDKMLQERREALAKAAQAVAAAQERASKKDHPAPLPTRDDPESHWEL